MPRVTPVYFDSALIAKFYLNEPGRDRIRQLARAKGVVATSGIAVAEVAAAFHRKLREDAVRTDTFEALESQFKHDREQGLWRLIGPADDLLEQVHELFQNLDKTVYLRAMDALHLITAKAAKFDDIYSNDRHLLAACTPVGLRGINPLAR
jgi:predicted nucleic acid-binding protein